METTDCCGRYGGHTTCCGLMGGQRREATEEKVASNLLLLEILGYGVMDPSCDCQKHFTSIVVLCRFCNKRTSSSNVSYSLNKASCSYSLQQLLLSHAWARSKLSQMGCLLESMPQRHGRLSGGNWIFGSRYCSWITPWPSTYPVWTIKDLFRMFELARKRLQDIFGFP